MKIKKYFLEHTKKNIVLSFVLGNMLTFSYYWIFIVNPLIKDMQNGSIEKYRRQYFEFFTDGKEYYFLIAALLYIVVNLLMGTLIGYTLLSLMKYSLSKFKDYIKESAQ